MSRKYVDGDSVRFTPSSFCQVDAELFGGERINALEPRRLFPLSGPDRYISLLNEEGKEQMIVRSLDSLDKKVPKRSERALPITTVYRKYAPLTDLPTNSVCSRFPSRRISEMYR